MYFSYGELFLDIHQAWKTHNSYSVTLKQNVAKVLLLDFSIRVEGS